MELRLLGPVELVVAGQPVAVGPPQRCAVLAALAVDAGRPVAAETLISRVWGDSQPDRVRRALHAHIARIRRLLETSATADERPVPVARRSGAYVLDIDPDRVDLHRFRRLREVAADRSRGAGARVALLREALAVWHGEPLAGLTGQWAARSRQGWRQLHLDTVREWAAAELAVDNPAAVITSLTELIDEHPFVEGLAALLMRALAAMGRATEALDLYSSMRARLVGELGTQPGTELRQAHDAILRGEPERPGLTPAPPRRVAPAQLPRDVRGFTGRVDELAQLDALLANKDEDPLAIGVVAGPAGVGKTALAVHWAHRVRARFPDGQLYVNLRGYAPGESTVDSAEAVRGFLAALQVPPQRIPAELDAQAALYRSELSNRRMLVLLDNARDAVQVRPLLPGTSGSAVVVTSRSQLTGLVASDGAHSITLDVLPAAHAWEMLRSRLGSARLAAEPDAVKEIIDHCARLPLALTIVAARAVTQPRIPLGAFAAELRDARLDALTTDDPATDVPAVFSWSYNDLSPDAARLFRLLALAPGPDIATAAAASLAGTSLPAARSLLTELATASLIVEHTAGRYTMHDLLRAYATDLNHRVDTAEPRHDAHQRILDHNVHTGHTAALLFHSGREPVPMSPPASGVCPEDLRDLEEALAWFSAEHANLLAAVSSAIDAGFDRHAWQLAWTLTDFLDRQGHWHDWIAVQRIAAVAGSRLAEPAMESDAHQQIGHALVQLGRFDAALDHLDRAMSLGEQAGDQAAQGQVRYSYAMLAARQDRYADALDHARRCLDLFTAAGQRHGQALARNTIGWIRAQLGDHRQAIAESQRALRLFEDIADHHGQGETWNRLGLAHHQLGNHPQAVDCYEHALALLSRLGDRYWLADTLDQLGDTHHAAGNLDAAADTWRQALSILDDLDHPDRERVYAKLAAIGRA